MDTRNEPNSYQHNRQRSGPPQLNIPRIPEDECVCQVAVAAVGLRGLWREGGYMQFLTFWHDHVCDLIGRGIRLAHRLWTSKKRKARVKVTVTIDQE
jgi:hypothetical protein